MMIYFVISVFCVIFRKGFQTPKLCNYLNFFCYYKISFLRLYFFNPSGICFDIWSSVKSLLDFFQRDK